MGARQFVVQEALLITWCSGLRSLSFTPRTMVASISSLAGTLSSTFLAPASTWRMHSARLRKTPVDSTTYSTPRSFQGRRAGSFSERTLISLPSTMSASSRYSTLPGNLRWVVSYLSSVAMVRASHRSLTATTSKSGRSYMTLYTSRPIRPKPLIPTRTGISFSSLWQRKTGQTLQITPHRRHDGSPSRRLISRRRPPVIHPRLCSGFYPLTHHLSTPRLFDGPWGRKYNLRPWTSLRCGSSGESLGPMKIEPSNRVRLLAPYLFGKLNDLKYQKRRQGLDIIDLGMGNPLDPTPQPVVEKLCQAVQDPRNHRYSSATGIFNLKREVAVTYEREWGVQVDPAAEIICTIGSKEGFSHLCLALLGEGDLAIVPQPSFPIHTYAVCLAGAHVVGVPLRGEEQLLRDVDQIMRRLIPKPKLIVLNFPHNPTTMTVSLDFFQDMARLARRHRLFVVSDLAYGRTAFDGYRPPSFLQAKRAKDVAVEFTTMSKAYNMAGWRVGYCVGNRHAIEALARVKAYYDYGIFQPVQIASIIALRHCDRDAADQASRYERRRDVLCDGLERAGWEVQRPKATMFVWARIPPPYHRLGSMRFAMQLMERALVAVAPGVGFGREGEGFLRLALVENEKRLQQAVRQIRRAFPVTGSAPG